MFFENSGYTGDLFEVEVIGEPKKVAWSATERNWRMRDGIEFAHKHNLTQHGPIAEAIRVEVSKQLGVNSAEVLVFNTLRTPLDVFHGTDCFFEFKGTVVTVDASLRNKGRYKADVQLGMEILNPDGTPNPNEINRLAEEIAGKWHSNWRRYQGIRAERQGGGIRVWLPT